MYTMCCCCFFFSSGCRVINKVGRRRRGAANTYTLWFDIEIKLQKFFYRLRSNYSRTPRKRPPKLTLLDSDCLYDLNRKRSISGNRSVQEPGLYYLEKHQFIRVQFWRSSFIRAVLFSVSRNFSQTLSRAVHTTNIVFRLSHVVTSDRYPLQNVTLKVNLLFLKLDRAYSISFDSSNVSNFLFLNEF